MTIQIQLRRGTASQWTSANTTLAQGEIGYETDTNKIKVGDGATAWTSLSYWVGGSGFQPLDGDLTAIAANTSNGILKRTATDTWTTITDNSTNWDTAYTERAQWDGGSTNLVAATGRTSLGATTVGGNLFTLTNPSAITFLKINANNTITTENAATHLSSIGAMSNPLTTTGDIIYSSSGNTAARLGIGTAGQALVTNSGATAPSWTTLTLENLPAAFVKKSVKAATTPAIGNITLSAGAPSSLDGITLALNDRVLVKDQTSTQQNGIYYVSTLGTGANGTWTRTLDGDTSDEIAGALINIDQGTVNGGQLWSNTFKPTDTLGTSTMPWYRVIDSSYSINIGTTAVSLGRASGSLTLAGLTLTSPVIDSIVGSAAGQAINLYTATTSTITIGSSTSTTTIAGTTFNAAAATSASIGTGTSATTINIGTGTGTTNKTIGIGTSSTAGTTTINIGSTTAGVAAINLDGTVTVKAGTASVAPFSITSGTNLTAGYAAGDFEFDSDKLYFTPNATTGRGMIQAVHMVALAGNSPTATTSTTATNIFATANKLLNLETAKMYVFRAKLYFTSTFTSGTAAVNFLPTFSNAPVNLKYRFITYPSTAGTAVSRTGFVTATGATQVTPSITATITYLVEIEGIFETNITAGGTITPQMSMTTTGSSTVGITNSTFEIVKVGANGATTIAGLWA